MFGNLNDPPRFGCVRVMPRPRGRDMQRHTLIERYRNTRQQTARLCEPLTIEDYLVQPVTEASPAKWHLGHTTWFFDTLVVKPYGARGTQKRPPLRSAYNRLFNSYYNAFGERVPQPERSLYSRPTVAETYRFRAEVDEGVEELLAHCDDDCFAEIADIIELGLQHEQQHQELLVTDIKRALFQEPLYPAYQPYREGPRAVAPRPSFSRFAGGLIEVGHTGHEAARVGAFAYDNESPRHQVFLQPFALADDLVSNAEYAGFIEDGGYSRPELWLSDGWAWKEQRGWQAPLYWLEADAGFDTFGLHGRQQLEPNEPVSHVSFYEAQAYATWRSARLPSEFEWEYAATATAAHEEPGTLLDDGWLRPIRKESKKTGVRHLLGEVWEWTQSAYLPYPGYQRPDGAYSEYNGKFMVNQKVLRGGSCATPATHLRLTYRNFFHPDRRWQFTGIRLALDVSS